MQETATWRKEVLRKKLKGRESERGVKEKSKSERRGRGNE